MRILYEDSRAATMGFGLHDFVLANTADVILGVGEWSSRTGSLS